jgi:hypothetical protein
MAGTMRYVSKNLHRDVTQSQHVFNRFITNLACMILAESGIILADYVMVFQPGVIFLGLSGILKNIAKIRVADAAHTG